jgi:hypothetical protein
MVYLCFMGCIVKMTLLLESFDSSIVHANFFGLGTSTHVCSQSINDRYIIKQHGSHYWYGFWTIKALVEAEVLYDGFTVSCRCIALLIIGRPLGVSLLISNHTTSIKPILRGKCFGHTGGVYTSSVAIKQAIMEQFGTKPCWEKDCLAWLMLYSSAS